MAHRSPHLARLDAGGVVHGMWMMTNSAQLARISSSVGYDYVSLDMQHGFIRPSDVVTMSDAIRAAGDSLVVARVADNRFAEIGMLADAGVEAVVVPLVSSADEARAAVDALRYPDAGGTRSWGPTHVVMNGLDPDPEVTRPLLLVMIENAEGLAAVEEICAIEGVDGVYVGPSDLAFSLGSRPGPEEQITTEAIARILEVARQAGVIPGIHCSNGAEAAARRAQGFRLITTSSDVGAARAAYATDLTTAKGAE